MDYCGLGRPHDHQAALALRGQATASIVNFKDSELDSFIYTRCCMKQIKLGLHAWRMRIAVVTGLATLCVLAALPGVSVAAPDQFSFGFGRNVGSYPVYGHGRYNYGNRVRYGYSGNANRGFRVYGGGPYGYQNGYGNSGYSGWNQNVNNYSPYNSTYYSPYSTWTYSPYGYGFQQYGY